MCDALPKRFPKIQNIKPLANDCFARVSVRRVFASKCLSLIWNCVAALSRLRKIPEIWSENMKRHFSVMAICLLAACGASSGGGTSTSTMTAPSAPVVVPPTVPVDRSFAGMLNNVRANNGAGAVSYDARLGRAAQGHANDMLANNYFSHTGRDGSSAGDRISREGYQWRTWGENIARGQRNEEAVLTAWVNSPGHQANNVNPNFEDFALAKAGSGSSQYWVLVFATER